ncbi:NAD(P)-specific glutamate dehydrogenase [Planctomycetes bacterium Poly30]|uniref:Glutamate dehydrogenase n=1 Tax=Saltatorellus ferox TaxID=2528018 RepID=A0A518F0N7_9BACT|nr:NAD(P)-specific glutamate dehydrogenase [Planctomycetes bacterium Poly30]
MCASVSVLVDEVRSVDPHQSEFHQAVKEVLESVVPVVHAHDEYRRAKVLPRLLEPDRIVRFRVTWEDDEGEVHVHRGWRVQHTNALGPYKGGLQLHPTVNEGVLKFLAFEQTFKNALTGLPLGAGKGGSDFDPKGRSDREVMRFCQAFMTQLWRYIGADTDVPAGDIGVGAREIGYLFGQYKRLAGQWSGAMTGKAMGMGGIPMRTEATGYGAVLFGSHALKHVRDETLAGKRAAVSGAGNVALYAAEKLIAREAKVITLSDSDGLLRIPGGLDPAGWEAIREIKVDRRGSLSDVPAVLDGTEFVPEGKPWGEACDFAFPCATQNELDEGDAKALLENGVRMVVEGANMPCTQGAIARFRDSEVIFAPGKAANAGGVAVSGLEMAQNAGKNPWSRERTEEELETIMQEIHDRCVEEPTAKTDGGVDYLRGANVAGFRRVADSMVASGLV